MSDKGERMAHDEMMVVLRQINLELRTIRERIVPACFAPHDWEEGSNGHARTLTCRNCGLVVMP